LEGGAFCGGRVATRKRETPEKKGGMFGGKEENRVAIWSREYEKAVKRE
jgi:hypothetical protein